MIAALSKPRKPLSRRTPLRSRSAPKRRTRLKPRSKKTAAKYEIRRELVARILAERPECEAGELLRSVFPMHVCDYYSDHVHEILTRARGGDILDEENVLALCARCHDQIHRHPSVSVDLGLLLHSWEQP